MTVERPSDIQYFSQQSAEPPQPSPELARPAAYRADCHVCLRRLSLYRLWACGSCDRFYCSDHVAIHREACQLRYLAVQESKRSARSTPY